MVETRTIRDVELIHCGSWGISTGEWTVTPADLETLLAAHHAGIMRKPVIKLGHVDERFDGEPSFGHIDNLRITNGGNTLVGDYVGVPAWLADGLPVHYPDRSVEAVRNVEAADGTHWPLVLTGCALLGATAPGIKTLQSLQSLIAAKHGPVITLRPNTVVRASGTDRAHTVLIAAARRRRTHRK